MDFYYLCYLRTFSRFYCARREMHSFSVHKKKVFSPSKERWLFKRECIGLLNFIILLSYSGGLLFFVFLFLTLHKMIGQLYLVLQMVSLNPMKVYMHANLHQLRIAHDLLICLERYLSRKLAINIISRSWIIFLFKLSFSN